MKHYWNSIINDDFIPQTIDIFFEENFYQFFSSDEVFSKDRADYGSMVLLRNTLNIISKSHCRVLDMGCGYGFLGIMIAKLREYTKVEMTDINERAVKLSKMNIQKHELQDRVVAYQGDKFSNCSGKYDIVVCNPPIRTGKENVYSIFRDAKEFISKNGKLIIVIKKKHGAPSAKKYLNEIYGNCSVLDRDKGYHILCSELY